MASLKIQEFARRNGTLPVPKFLLACGIFLQMAAAAPVPVNAFLAGLSVPPGGTAQLQVFLNAPQAFVSGSAEITLDPAIFDNIIAADAYSATGDQVGSASISGRTVDIEFTSQTGGVGRMPGLPLVTVTVPVLATARVGAQYSLAWKAGSQVWIDIQGYSYSVNVTSGTFTVGGDVSVSNVGIVGGLLAAGSTVEVNGSGFTNGTTLAIDGVAIAGVRYLSPQKIEVTMGSAAELDFRRVTVRNPGGSGVPFYPVLHGATAAVQPIVPLQRYGPAGPIVGAEYSSQSLALLNPTAGPVDVGISTATYIGRTTVTQQSNLTLQPGALDVIPLTNNVMQSLTVTPAVPIRMAQFGATGSSLVSPVVLEVSIPSAIPPPEFAWNAGTAVPAPLTYTAVSSVNAATPFTATVSGLNGNAWLSVSPATGTACPSASPNCPGSQLVLTCNPVGLAAGTYTATVILTAIGLNSTPVSYDVPLTVYGAPTIFGSTLYPAPTFYSGEPRSYATSIAVTSSYDPVPFTVTTNIPSGGRWLTVDPASGSTPAQLLLTFNADQFAGTSDQGTVTIHGPKNSINYPVSISVSPARPGVLASVTPLLFAAALGQAAPLSQTIPVPPTVDPISVSAQTSSGGAWLSVVIGAAVPTPIVSVNPAGLAAGTYQGAVTVSSASTAYGPLQPSVVPVTLVVAATFPPIATSVTSISMTAPHGTTAAAPPVNISTGNFPEQFDVQPATADGGSWLAARVTNGLGYSYPYLTPWSVDVGAVAANLTPGVYSGSVKITSPPGSATTAVIQVTFAVTPAPPPLPQAGTVPRVSAVLNAASQRISGVAPGEILTIFGQNFGPASASAFALGGTGRIATNPGGVQVTFDGIAAPVIYGSATQINAIVPYEVAGLAVTNIAVVWNGTAVAAGSYPVVGSVPGIFTVGSGGLGQGAVLNQDGSVNSAGNPAARGSTVQIFATGEGSVAPTGITGEVTGADIKLPVLPVTVSIGGLAATVSYAGSAPDAVAGLFQVNAMVPAGVVPGPAVPVALTVGGTASQTGVTIAVK